MERLRPFPCNGCKIPNSSTMIVSSPIGVKTVSAIKTTSPLLAALDTQRLEVILLNLGEDAVYIKRSQVVAGNTDDASATNFDFTLNAAEKVVMYNWQGRLTCYPATGVSINVSVLGGPGL